MQIYPCQFLRFKTRFKSRPVASRSPWSSARSTRLFQVTSPPPFLLYIGEGQWIGWYQLALTSLTRSRRRHTSGQQRPISKILQPLKTPPKLDFSKTLPDLTTSSAPILGISRTSLCGYWLLRQHLQVRAQVFFWCSNHLEHPPPWHSRLLEGWSYILLGLCGPTHRIPPGGHKALKEHLRRKQAD